MEIRKTPLYDNHIKYGGKVVEFAGWYLPMQYEAGIIAEHNAVRNNVGLFDVSHMGEFLISGSGAMSSVNNLVTNDISDMVNGQVKYSLMLNDEGGEVDDLLIYRVNSEVFLLVVNASNCEKDAKWVSSHLLANTTFEDVSDKTGQVALQGRNAEKILLQLVKETDIPHKHYTFVTNTALCGIQCLISRTGYTGEDGFEIYCDSKDIVKIFDEIKTIGDKNGMLLCGLGCRDTLRFEACLPLYGHELNENFLATEVGLGFCIKMDKASFIGKTALLDNQPKFKRKGIAILDKGIAREGCIVYGNKKQIGHVSTGTFSPTLGKAIAMVRIDKDYEGEIEVDVRGRMLKAEFVKMPFYKAGG